MDVNAIIALVGSLGFPIAAAIAMGAMFYKTNENYRDDLKSAGERHKMEMDKITEAINNNTLIIQKLVDKIDKDGD